MTRHRDARTRGAAWFAAATLLLATALAAGCAGAGGAAGASQAKDENDGGHIAARGEEGAGGEDSVASDGTAPEVLPSADVDATGAGDATAEDADGTAHGDADVAATLPDDGPATRAPIEKIAFGGDFVPFVMTNSADGADIVAFASKGPTSLKLIYGPQGGHHVWITTCVPQLVTGPISVAFGLRDMETGELHAPSPVKLKTWHKNLTAVPGYRCRGPLALYVSCPCAIDGRPLRLEVELEGAEGKHAWLTAPVVAVHGDTPCEAPLSPDCVE